jgi:hypothetical protein
VVTEVAFALEVPFVVDTAGAHTAIVFLELFVVIKILFIMRSDVSLVRWWRDEAESATDLISRQAWWSSAWSRTSSKSHNTFRRCGDRSSVCIVIAGQL